MSHSWQEHADVYQCRWCKAVRKKAVRWETKVIGWRMNEFGEQYPVTEQEAHIVFELFGTDSLTKCNGKSNGKPT